MREDWIEFELKDVFSVVTGNTPSKNDAANYGIEIPFIKPPNLWNGPVTKTQEYLTEKGAGKSRVLPPFSTLVTCIGNLGRVGINKKIVAFNQQINAIKPTNSVDPFFTFYQAQSPSFKLQLEKKSSATTVAIVNKGNFEKIKYNLAPLPEQRAIVAKIEELFSSLESGISDLKKAQEQLKIYRQAVLKKAFEGKFTNQDVKEGELPNGWKWKTIKEITSVLGDGLHGTPQYSQDGEYFFINGNNLSNGKIEIKENTKRVSKVEFEKYKKLLNDKTIFVSINGTLGNTAFYNQEKVILGKSACYFNVLDNTDKRYVRYCLTSQRFINFANNMATGSTIKNVGLKTMREFEIPKPPTLTEQVQIVQEIESRLSVCDKVEESIVESLEKSKALRQSILKKAFEGRLLNDQERAACKSAPDYEPASVLLERIKAEKATGAKTVKVKKSKLEAKK